MVSKEINKIYVDIQGVVEKARPFNIVSEENNSLVILIHGFTGSPYDMHNLADYLFSQGFDINTILLKGHGGSLESLRNSTYVDWYTSLKEVIQSNVDRYDNIFVIGYSFGANLGFEACLKFDQIKGIISLGIPIYLQEEKYIRLLLPLARIFKRNYRKKWINKRYENKLKEYGKHSHIPIKSIVNFYNFIDNHTKKNISLVNTPSLIIHARNDYISHSLSSEFVFKNLNTKDKDLFILNKAKHSLAEGSRKDFVYNKILDFINSHK